MVVALEALLCSCETKSGAVVTSIRNPGPDNFGLEPCYEKPFVSLFVCSGAPETAADDPGRPYKGCRQLAITTRRGAATCLACDAASWRSSSPHASWRIFGGQRRAFGRGGVVEAQILRAEVNAPPRRG